MAKEIFEKLNGVMLDLTQENAYEKSKELSKIMCSKKTREEVEYLLETDVKLLKNDIELMKTILGAARLIYEYSGFDTGMTDSEYDIIFHKLEKYVDPLTANPSIKSKNRKVFHRYPSLRGTLDKIYGLTPEDKVDNPSQDRLDDWIKQSESRIYEQTGKRYNLNNVEIILFPKFDGVSCVFEFREDGTLERALTKGYTEGSGAKDITHIFKGRVTGPYKKSDYPYAVKTEIMMTDSDFEKCNEEFHTNYKQSRSIVSSIINSDEVDGRVKYLRIMPLRWSYFKNGIESLQQLAPGVYDTAYRVCKLRDRDTIRDFAEHVRNVDGLRTDGVVIYINDKQIQEILGRAKDRQKFEVAYKFTEVVGYTKVKDIHFSTGLFGTLTPIVDVKPIVLKGNTITSPSIGNYSRFRKLHLAKGDVVKIIYDIVPYLTFDDYDPKCKRSENYPIEPPHTCAECGYILEEVTRESGIHDLVCRNEDCPAKEKGRILNYLIRIGIDGVGVSTIELLYDAGYLKSIKDLYKLEKKEDKILKLKGMGSRSFDYLTTMIDVKRDLYASDFMSAIGIKGLSKATFRQIFSHIGMDEFMEHCLGDRDEAELFFCEMKGIRNKTAGKIIEGVRKNKDLIDFLENELVIHDDPKSSKPKCKVCFSKIRSKEIEHFITDHGGVVSDALTLDCNLLIVPDLAVTSGKTKLAMKRNIPIITIENAKKYISENLL